MFTHCHFHTSYSLLDGYNPIKKAVRRLKELNMKACAITDHGSLGGIPEWQEECEKNDIKALLGVEGYWTWNCEDIAKNIDTRKQDAYNKYLETIGQEPAELPKVKGAELKQLNELLKPYMYDTHSYHIILIAMNQVGWRNLIKLQSIASDKYHYKNRWHIDDNLLREYNEGLIYCTACIGSAPSKMIQVGKYDEAERIILNWKEIFGDRLYLEIQPLNIDKQWITNEFYMAMSKKHGIKAVATNDVHYTYKEDHEDHDTLLCIGMKTYKTEEIAKEAWRNKHNGSLTGFVYNRIYYDNEFWIRDEEEMLEAFSRHNRDHFQNDSEISVQDYTKFYQEAIQNTQEIADRCNDHIELGSSKPLFPQVDLPEGITAEDYLESLAWQGLYRYLAEHTECDSRIYEKRLRDEMNIICGKGFAPYMLAVREYIQWANANGCETGPGRGSASGSLCLLCLGITKNIDPIKYGLMFSRFLTADRKDPPDIDTDFLDVKMVERHLEEKYGVDHVAKIGTYGTLAVKSGLKDICKVLGVSFADANAISKRIDEVNVGKAQPEFKDYDELAEGSDSDKQEWEKFHAIEMEYPEYFRLARAFEGSPKNYGVHASGVLVTPVPVTDYAPIHRHFQGSTDKVGLIVTLWTGPQLEHIGCIKFDVLGLNTIRIFRDCLRSINKELTFDDLYKAVDVNDASLYDYLRTGETDGIFQLESGMMKSLVKDMQPESLEDVTAINACGRPGPLTAGFPKMFGEGKRGNPVQPPIRGCDDILGPTYFVPVFQEQLMLISKKVSGFDDMQADSITRKVMAKKKRALFPMMKRCHIFGKKNCEGPEGWEDDMHAPWYDPKGKLGKEIPGAISNGYTEKEMLDYFDAIEGFASYAFNKSHSVCYAYIGLLSTFLKKNYPEEFMSAVISTAPTTPVDKRAYYLKYCEENLGIKIMPPDINKSGEDFTPDSKNHQILYGLAGIKGVGAAAVPGILANRPYTNIEDAIQRIPKKSFNKRIGENLIKAGAFDFEMANRYALLNEFHSIRKDKKEEPLDVQEYNPAACIEMETATIGFPLTFKPWWDDVKTGSSIKNEPAVIKNVRETKDRRGGLMAFVDLEIHDCPVSAVVFASAYGRLVSAFDMNLGTNIVVSGKKQAPQKPGQPATLMINSAQKVQANPFEERRSVA